MPRKAKEKEKEKESDRQITEGVGPGVVKGGLGVVRKGPGVVKEVGLEGIEVEAEGREAGVGDIGVADHASEVAVEEEAAAAVSFEAHGAAKRRQPLLQDEQRWILYIMKGLQTRLREGR